MIQGRLVKQRNAEKRVFNWRLWPRVAWLFLARREVRASARTVIDASADKQVRWNNRSNFPVFSSQSRGMVGGGQLWRCTGSTGNTRFGIFDTNNGKKTSSTETSQAVSCLRKTSKDTLQQLSRRRKYLVYPAWDKAADSNNTLVAPLQRSVVLGRLRRFKKSSYRQVLWRRFCCRVPTICLGVLLFKKRGLLNLNLTQRVNAEMVFIPHLERMWSPSADGSREYFRCGPCVQNAECRWFDGRMCCEVDAGRRPRENAVTGTRGRHTSLDTPRASSRGNWCCRPRIARHFGLR